ncbi:MAG: hypothetical protein KDC32_15615, partial [Saprospiraceae bacterium]|nr:hypothetical protein [Saprospiraceae bacterium]
IIEWAGERFSSLECAAAAGCRFRAFSTVSILAAVAAVRSAAVFAVFPGISAFAGLTIRTSPGHFAL